MWVQNWYVKSAYHSKLTPAPAATEQRDSRTVAAWSNGNIKKGLISLSMTVQNQEFDPEKFTARPTKELRSKCDSAECAEAKASQFRVARRDTAPTELMTAKLRTLRCTPASAESWRWAREMARRAAAAEPVPVPTSRPVSAR